VIGKNRIMIYGPKDGDKLRNRPPPVER
jgi:hypothetical protein